MRFLSFLLLLLFTVPGRAQAPDSACADAESCMNEGLRLLEGAETAKGAELMRLSCGKGSGLACAYAELAQAAYGEAGASRPVSAGDAARAWQRLDADCDAGKVHACYLSAVALESGMGAAMDPGAALQQYDQACSGNVARACYRQGLLFDGGPTAWRDPVQADALFRQACNGDEPAACYALARKLDSSGSGRASDAVVQLYERGCTGKHMPSCTALGRLHQSGRVANPDPAEAKRLLERACKGGDSEACSSK